MLPGSTFQGPRWRPMKMSHMLADTKEELLAMAEKIGLRKEWLQGEGSDIHFDVSKTKRREAIKAGAIPVTVREMVKIRREKRK